jgi:hypothetical protein
MYADLISPDYTQQRGGVNQEMCVKLWGPYSGNAKVLKTGISLIFFKQLKIRVIQKLFPKCLEVSSKNLYGNGQ